MPRPHGKLRRGRRFGKLSLIALKPPNPA
jgi:hypothetical protein